METIWFDYMAPQSCNPAETHSESARSHLVLMDWNTIELIQENEPPVTPYSHDRCMCQFAHELLRKGERVYIGTIGKDPTEQKYIEVSGIYPSWKVRQKEVPYNYFQPHLVVGVHLADLNLKPYFPDSKIVMVNAALAFVEYPAYFEFSTGGMAAREALCNSIDYIHVQNPRMKEIASVFYRILAGWQHEERILVYPFGICPEEKFELIDRATMRAEMGLKDTDIAIINSGGIWKWTDFNTLLRAFLEVVREENRQHLKLYIMGFRQAENTDHGDYIHETHALIDANKDLIGKNIFTFSNWNDVGKKIKSYTAAADIGVNVNKDSFEHWQSYRVRFIEYMQAGIAVINTRGDYLSSYDAEDAVYQVGAQRVDECKTALRHIAKHPEDLAAKKAAMKKCVPLYSSNYTTASFIDILLAGTPLERDVNAEDALSKSGGWRSRKIALFVINIDAVVSFINRFVAGRKLISLAKKIRARLGKKNKNIIPPKGMFRQGKPVRFFMRFR